MRHANRTRAGRAGSLLAMGLAASLLAACGPASTEPAPPSDAEGCQEFDTISFGLLSPSAGYWLPLYADEVGLWEEHCIVLDVVAIANTANLLTAVTTGDLQLTAVPTANGFAAIAEGMDLVAVASNQNVNDATFVARPEIASAADLRGKVIGTASLASAATLAMIDILDAAGVKEGEYEIIAGGGTGERQAALSSGAYDATWLLAPGDIALLDEGYTNLGTIGDAFPDDVYSSLFASRSWAEDNDDLMDRILRVWTAASAAFYDDANRTVFEKVLVDEAGASPEIAKQTFDRYRRLSAIAEDGGIRTEQVYTVFDVMLRIGTLSTVPNEASGFVDLSYWAQATGNSAPDPARP